MNKITITAITVFISALASNAQISKTSIVEHFTNTNCSVCKSNNPGINATITNYPSVLHISFYPSAPYAACFFSKQNTVENDDRTKFYGVYGATPRLVANGKVLASSGTIGSTLSAAASEMTNFKLTATQSLIGTDSIAVEIVAKKIANDTNSSALLFAGAIEDTIIQTTSNGETEHFHVFRKALTNAVGNVISLPVLVGDSIIYTFGYKVKSGWAISKMNSIALIQNPSSKELINAAKSNKVNSATGMPDTKMTKLNLYPNPSNTIIMLDKIGPYEALNISNATGDLIYSTKNYQQSIDVSKWPSGIYLVQLTYANMPAQFARISIHH